MRRLPSRCLSVRHVPCFVLTINPAHWRSVLPEKDGRKRNQRASRSPQDIGNPHSGPDRKFNAFSQMALVAKRLFARKNSPNSKRPPMSRPKRKHFEDGTVNFENVKYSRGSVLKFAGTGKERANFAQRKVLSNFSFLHLEDRHLICRRLFASTVYQAQRWRHR
jgi:hypothetical protein